MVPRPTKSYKARFYYEPKITNCEPKFLLAKNFADNFIEKPKRQASGLPKLKTRGYKFIDQVARLISIARLKPLLTLHLRPINLVIYQEP